MVACYEKNKRSFDASVFFNDMMATNSEVVLNVVSMPRILLCKRRKFGEEQKNLPRDDESERCHGIP